jgi:hypothetical protein
VARNEKRTLSSSRVVMGLACGAGAALAARHLAARDRMAHRVAYERMLAVLRGPAEANRLATLAESRYQELRASVRRPSRQALRLHLRYLILPALAMYQTLIESGDDPRVAYATAESLVASRVEPSVRLLGLMRLLPNPFGVFRAMTREIVRIGFPPEGFTVEPLDDSGDVYSYNVRRCFYLDTLTDHGAAELTPVFCGADDLVFSALGPAVDWRRSGTLGRGQDRCDFCWHRGAMVG